MAKEQALCAPRSHSSELWALFVFVFLVGILTGYALKAYVLVEPVHKEESQS